MLRSNKDVYAEMGLVSAAQDEEMGRRRQAGIADMEAARREARASRDTEFEKRLLAALEGVDLSTPEGKDLYWQHSLAIGCQMDEEEL